MKHKKQHLLRLEAKTQPLLPTSRFLQRFLVNFCAASLLIGFSLLLGMGGYAYFEKMEWVDAFANAAMILSGMGPLGELHTRAGKIFAGCYALYSGLLLILVTGIVLAPIVHRFLHRFHLEEQEE
jgi:hypothetical protein